MQPTLQPGQVVWLLAYRPWFNPPSRSAVVVFRAPSGLPAKRYVKRLVALPGDRVSVRADGFYLNGKRQQEPYARWTDRADTFPDIVMVAGKVVALEGYAISELPIYLKASVAMLEPVAPDLMRQSFQAPVTLTGTLRLTSDSFFVLGDNRAFHASEDSRAFGPLKERDILWMVRKLRA